MTPDTAASSTHWLTRYDLHDGEPYGELCSCSRGSDHEALACINCGEPITDENDPCYGHPDATPEWPRFHTEPA